jgi:hypothetical protein
MIPPIPGGRSSLLKLREVFDDLSIVRRDGSRRMKVNALR